MVFLKPGNSGLRILRLAACALLRELAEHGPTQEELERAREQAKASVLMGLESIQARMSHLGTSQLLYGSVLEQDDILDAYDAVTVPQLRQLAEQIFDFSQLSLSAVGRVPPAEVAIRFLCASASNRVTPSYTAGFFTMTSYTCLLIFRFATRAYWPGISDKKPISSLINASRVMVNWVP